MNNLRSLKRPRIADSVVAAPRVNPSNGQTVPLDTRVHWHHEMERYLQATNNAVVPRFQRRSINNWQKSVGSNSAIGKQTGTRPGARGDAIVERVIALIEKTERISGRYRYPSQLQMHRAFLAANLRFIYKDDWSHVEREVLCRFGLPRSSQEVLVRTGRQVGKTTAIRMFTAALLLSVPDVIVAVCAPSLTQAKSILGPVKDNVKLLLASLRETEYWEIIVDNTTEFVIVTVTNGLRNTRSIKAYPGNPTVS